MTRLRRAWAVLMGSDDPRMWALELDLQGERMLAGRYKEQRDAARAEVRSLDRVIRTMIDIGDELLANRTEQQP